MDLDGDGHDDVLTGSYWPGDIYLFRGKGGGQYAKGEVLKDASGKNVNGGKPWKSENDPDMDSLAAAPHAADLDGDGDHDLLIGNIAGRVIIIENVGTKTAPKFSAEKRALEAGGGVLKVEGDAGPIAADWNQDGTLDLIVGAGDGAVRYFQNLGTKTAPRFAKGVDLIPPSDADRRERMQEGTDPKGHGLRTKVCVNDANRDGTLDLLVGDYVSQQSPEPNLTPEQRKKRDELRKEQDDLQAEIAKLYEASKDLESEPLKRLMERSRAVYEDLGPLEARRVPHGWVWLFLGKSAVAVRWY